MSHFHVSFTFQLSAMSKITKKKLKNEKMRDCFSNFHFPAKKCKQSLAEYSKFSAPNLSKQTFDFLENFENTENTFFFLLFRTLEESCKRAFG